MALKNLMDKKIRVLIIVLLANLSVCIGKITIGLISGFLFIVADGIHSLSDTLTNIVGIFSMKLSAKKPDEKHPYGYEKYETIGTLIVGCFCMFLAFEILKTAISSILHPPLRFAAVELAYTIMIINIPVDMLIYLYESHAGKNLKSDLLLADAIETRSDILLSAVITVGIFFTNMGYPILNGILTLVLSIIIMNSALNILKGASEILTDVNVVPKEKIYSIVMSHPEVRFCHAIRSRGKPDAIYMDLHMGVDPNMTVEHAHDVVSHEVKLMLKKEIPGLKCANIQIEPDNIAARKRERSVFKEVDY